MARQTSLRGKLRRIIRRYKKISSKRYLYNSARSLKQAYKHVMAWFLIHDAKRGYSIILIRFRRKEKYSVPQWTRAYVKAGIVGSLSLFQVFTQNILPAINVRSGASWKFKALIGWTGDIPKIKHSPISAKHHSTKARRTNVSSKHRRRH